MTNLEEVLDWRGLSHLLAKHPDASYEFMRLDGAQQKIFLRWLRLCDEITAQKILSRSMRYWITGLVIPRGDGHYEIQGDHTKQPGQDPKSPYLVDLNSFTCTYDRATGKGKYLELRGPCSHLCAAELFAARIGPHR